MIQILKIKIIIQFVTIYLRINYIFQNNGKMNNIIIHRKMKMELHKLYNNLSQVKFQMMKIIMIH